MKQSFLVMLIACVSITLGGCLITVQPPSAYVVSQQTYAEPQQVQEIEPVPVEVQDVQEEVYVAPVIEYGVPVYLPPPVVVSYPYDYYVYENHGGFVNIVFLRGGHRIRSEVWKEGGRRMTARHIDAWRQQHKVSQRLIENQRHMLEANHHIKRSDAFYGIKPRQENHQVARPNVNNKASVQGRQVPQPQRQLQPGQQRQQTKPAEQNRQPNQQVIRKDQQQQGQQRQQPAPQQQARQRNQQPQQNVPNVQQQQAQAREQQRQQQANARRQQQEEQRQQALFRKQQDDQQQRQQNQQNPQQGRHR